MGEPLAYVSIGLIVCVGALLYVKMSRVESRLELLDVLQERFNESRKDRINEDSRVMARLERQDREWKAVFTAQDEYLKVIERRIQRLEDRVDDVQGRHDGEPIDLNGLT
jgi:hypothetical protein